MNTTDLVDHTNLRNDIPDFSPGDTLKVHVRVVEGQKERVQVFQGVVIGRSGRRIPRHAARDHIAGLTLGNEGTIRDWVRHAKFNVTQGKNWERSGSLGLWMVTMDEVGDVEALRLTTRVNGELRQDDTPATMAFPIEAQIEYLSTFCTLEPGDLIFTGTPTGAGARFDPPVWLKPGDLVEVEADRIGCLRNGVVDER